MMNGLPRDPFDLTIKPVPVRQLLEFANAANNDPLTYAVLPIDPIRAAAQALNPVADEKDIGLMVAYSEGRCIGHQGLIPIQISIDGELRKVIASVALFIHSDFRGKRNREGLTVAEAIYRRSLDHGYDIMNTGFGRARQRLHERRPEWFVRLPPLFFRRIRLSYLQPLSTGLRRLALRSRGDVVLRAYRLAQGIIDRRVARVYSHLLGTGIASETGEWRIVKVEKIIEPKHVDATSKSSIYFPRSTETINWMVTHPWHPIGGNPYPRCYFCNSRERFEYSAFHFINSAGSGAGYFVLVISTDQLYTTLRILDFHVTDRRMEPQILKFAIREALRQSANSVECSDRFGSYINANPLLHLLTYRMERPYWLGLQPTSPLANRLGEVCVDYCDGERPYL